MLFIRMFTRRMCVVYALDSIVFLHPLHFYQTVLTVALLVQCCVRLSVRNVLWRPRAKVTITSL